MAPVAARLPISRRGFAAPLSHARLILSLSKDGSERSRKRRTLMESSAFTDGALAGDTPFDRLRVRHAWKGDIVKHGPLAARRRTMVSKMSRLFAALFLAAALVLPADAAATTGSLQDCAAIATPVERLGCYDALARKAAAARGGPGVWTLDATPSRLNPDLTDLVLWTRSVNAVPGPGDVPVHAVLLLQCRHGGVAVEFDFGSFVGGGATRIEYRIGSGAVLAGDVTVAPDHRRFGVWQRGRAIGFIKALYGQPQLRLRVAPPAGDPLIAAFDLDGLEEAMAPLRDSCGWD